MAIYNSMAQLVGNTPLVRLSNVEKKYALKAKLVAKMEYFNPAGSVKDRVGKAIIDDAIKNGRLNKDTVIIEPTSGNTGIGLASYAAAMGYQLIITMPESMSIERRNLMTAYGARLVLTDASKGMAGAIEKAKELNAEIENSIIAGQFENPVNPQIHYQTTGPEIWQEINGNIDVLVAGVGTGGTITGTGKYLKEQNSNIEIVAVEPKASAVLSGEKAGAHKIQGIGAGFIPEILDVSVIDKIIAVDNDDAIKTGAMLPKTEGALIGISGGAALWAAISLAQQDEYSDKTIVVILPDSGDRYLTSEMFV